MVEPLKETALRKVGLVGVVTSEAIYFTSFHTELPQKDVPTAGNSNEYISQSSHMAFTNCSRYYNIEQTNIIIN